MASAVACKGAAPASLLKSGAPVAFCALHSPAVTADRRPYNGGSGYCYLIDFPVETMVYEANDRKVGYFKIRKAQQQSAAGRAMSPGVTAAVVVVSLVLASLAMAGAYIGWEWWLRQRRASGQGMEQELTPGHYRDLKSMDSPNNSFKT